MPKPKKAVKDEMPPLPKAPLIGDRVRLKPERISEYRKACELAGYDCDLYAIRVVTRTDSFGPGGDKRFFVDGPPHCFRGPDLMLAWNSDAERRAGLDEHKRKARAA